MTKGVALSETMRGWLQLRHSLTTCPMTVYRGGEPIGPAEVRYEDSILAFPFKALRLTHSDNAFGEYGGSL